MKKIIVFLILVAVMVIGGQLWRNQMAMQAVTGGFGTKYKDSPYPFNDPSFPVDCFINNYKLKEVILKVQQDKTTLNIPADAYFEARRRADSKVCRPIDIKLKYAFYNGRLLRHSKLATALGESEARVAGYSGTGPQKRQLVEVTLVDLLQTPQETRQQAQKDNPIDLPRYQPQLKMKHYPLWFYPNAYDRKFGKKGRWNLVLKYGYGVMGSNNPFTHKPNIVRCDVISGRKSSDPDNEISRNKVINANTIYKTGNCLGSYYIVTDETVLRLEINVYPEAAPYIDEIYAQLDGIIKSYIVASTTNKTDLTNPSIDNTGEKP